MLTATPGPTTTLTASPANGQAPAVVDDHSAGWDPVSRRVILQAWPADMTSAPTTWAWDGLLWSQLSPQHQLPAQREASMAVDPVSGRLLLMGGTSLSSPADPTVQPQWGSNDGTWLWTGSDWNRVADNPTQGGHPALAADDATGRLVVNCPNILGVETPSGVGPGQLTLPMPSPSWAGQGSFSWTGSAWVAAGGSVPLVLNAAVGYDPISRRVIQFGGQIQGNVDQTAAFDGSSWTLLQPVHVPPYGAAVGATDAALGYLVVLANPLDNPNLATTWTWNGADWIRQVVNEPPATALEGYRGPNSQMLWDPAVNRVVLIGRSSNASPTLSVWAWTGTDQGWQILGP